jgi:hypothetical protein
MPCVLVAEHRVLHGTRLARKATPGIWQCRSPALLGP